MMGLRERLAQLFNPFRHDSNQAKRRRKNSIPGIQVEDLESRLVLYAATGNAWPTPDVITISFEPDGTNLGGVSSNLNAAFNAQPALNGVWQQEILRAAQVWSQATNINFVVVGDSGAAIGSGLYQQGSPTIGDIRIGGYSFGNSFLAQAFQPPPVNNQSLGGDIEFNTAQTFNVGSGTDLFTVAVHEFGHALGLDHSAISTSEMYWAYNGVKPSLTSDDIAGIRNIYSNNNARAKDNYEGAGGNDTINNASSVTGPLKRSTKSGIIDGLDLTTTSDTDFYKVNIPTWASSTMVVRVQATGLSMLAPNLTVYGDDKVTVLGTVTGTSGSTISFTVNGIHNNDNYYFKVEGADESPFGMGAYGLTMDLGADSPPLVTPPNTTLLNGVPYSSGGGEADTFIDDTLHVASPSDPAAPTVAIAASNGLTGTAAAGSVITVSENDTVIGTTTADDAGNWSFSLAALPKGTYELEATVTDAAGISSLPAEITLKIRRHS